jgi:hypothetical protein
MGGESYVDKSDSVGCFGGSTFPACHKLLGMLAREIGPVMSPLRLAAAALSPAFPTSHMHQGAKCVTKSAPQVLRGLSRRAASACESTSSTGERVFSPGSGRACSGFAAVYPEGHPMAAGLLPASRSLQAPSDDSHFLIAKQKNRALPPGGLEQVEKPEQRSLQESGGDLLVGGAHPTSSWWGAANAADPLRRDCGCASLDPLYNPLRD